MKGNYMFGSTRARCVRERDVQAAIIDYCHAEGIFVRRRNVAGGQKLTGGRYVRLGTKGEADLWGILCGRHWECEVKRKGETPRTEQLAWLELCAQAGALAFWVDSLDDFIAIVTGGGLRPQ